MQHSMRNPSLLPSPQPFSGRHIATHCTTLQHVANPPSLVANNGSKNGLFPFSGFNPTALNLALPLCVSFCFLQNLCVCVCVCVRVYACVCTWMQLCVCVYALFEFLLMTNIVFYTRKQTWKCTYTHTHTHTHVHTHTHTYTFTRVLTHTHTHTHAHTRTHTHAHTHKYTHIICGTSAARNWPRAVPPATSCKRRGWGGEKEIACVRGEEGRC